MKKPVNQTPRVDSLGRRLPHIPQSTGKRVELTQADIQLFQFYNRHGDLPVTLAFQYLNAMGLAKDFQSTVKRHCVLFHEDNTAYGGTYLERDHNQWGTDNSRYHPRIHRLTDRGKQVLRDEGVFKENTPRYSNSWKHDFLRACVSASREISCLREPDKYEYLPHHRIVELIGQDSFMPEWKQIGKRRVKVNQLRPDVMDGVFYKEDDSLIVFLNEIDCKTEQVRNTAKNSHNTFERKLDLYRKFIKGGLYKDVFKMDGGVMVSTVTVNRGHMNELVSLMDNAAYLLFNTVDNFDFGFVPPKDIFPLFNEPWVRPGNTEFFLNSPK